MKILHVNAGNEYGGGLYHIVSLIGEMKDKHNVSLLVFEDGPVAHAARKNGITVHVLEQKSKYNVKFPTLLQQFIKHHGYDLIHTHGPRANTFIKLIIKSIRPVKWIVTLHSNPELDFLDQGYKGKLLEFVHVKSFIHADLIIAVSEEIKNIAVKYGVPTEQTAVIHNGIEFREIESETEDEEEVFTLLSVGRLEKIKGHELLIQALSKLNFENWQLVLCGDGAEIEHLKMLAKDYQLTDQIHFAGWVEKEELDHYYSKADVFVLPSFSESFSLVVLEAMEHKLPVIATDVGDMGLMFPESTKEFLIEENNEKELKTAIRKAASLWEDKSLETAGCQMYEHGKQFSLENQAEKTAETYQLVID